MTRIACIGEAMIELSLVDNDAQVGVAGDTLNTAIYMRRTAPKLSVDYVTCLGDDPFSDRVRNFVLDKGIGTSSIRTIKGASPGLYAITTTPDGERSFTYWRNASAARQQFSDGDFSVLDDFDAVYLSGISLAILPNSVRLTLIDKLRASSVKVIYDSNYRPKLWERQDVAQGITTALWDRADIVLPSIDDEMLLFNETADQVAARFEKLGTLGALKRGKDGPLSLGEPVHQSYTPAAKVVDTTAAGDSFNGGYLGALLSGKNQAESLRAGHDMAAAVVQHRGAIIPE